jgi:hypothetical protein
VAVHPVFAMRPSNSKEPSVVHFRLQWLFALFAVELFAISLARIPDSMRFSGFAFCDHGSNLALQNLISQNLRPGVDFGYLYGLLSALVGRVWFKIWGLTPWSYQIVMLALNVVCAFALAATYSRVGIGRLGLLLTVISLGFGFQATYPNIAHGLEAAFLCLALAEQANGRRAIALAITSVGIFVKPSMAYPYTLLLTFLIVCDLARRPFDVRRWSAAFAPAALAFLITAAVLILKFGWSPVIQTALPTQGATIYRVMNFGIFGVGSSIWNPGKGWLNYLITHSGFWIIANLFLDCVAIIEIGRALMRREYPNLKAELIITCAILHSCFVFFFFGNQFSWIYYSYLLVIGCALALDLGNNRESIGVALCIIALFSWTGLGYWTHRWWTTMAPARSTEGLWATTEERGDWEKVLSIVAGHRAVILHEMGAVELLFPGFEQPVSTYLMEGLMLPGDVARKRAQLSSAEMVVVSLTDNECSGIADDPAFSRSLEDFYTQWRGHYFEVLRRRSPL